MFFLGRIGLDWERRAPLLLRPNDAPALGPPRLAHLKAHEYVAKRWMTQDQFDAYFKFAFVRNPWDRVASFYRFLGFDRLCSFPTFVRRHLPVQIAKKAWFLCPQVDYVQGPGSVALVDFVGRFESLTRDFVHVCDRMGIVNPTLSHVNDSRRAQGLSRLTRRRPLPYRQMYDTRSRELVGTLYADDVEAFSYDF